MKTFVYWVGVFVIVAIMFALPIFSILSFCLNWDSSLKCLLIAPTVVDFTVIMLIVGWFVEDMSDN